LDEFIRSALLWVSRNEGIKVPRHGPDISRDQYTTGVRSNLKDV